MRCQLENIRKLLTIIEPVKSGPKHNGGRQWEIEHVVEHVQKHHIEVEISTTKQ